MKALSELVMARFAYLLAGWQVGLAVTLARREFDHPAYFWVPMAGAVLWPGLLKLLSYTEAPPRRWRRALVLGVGAPVLVCFVLHSRQTGTLAAVWQTAVSPHEVAPPKVLGVEPPGAASAGVGISNRDLFVAARETAGELGRFGLRVLVGTPRWLYAAFALAVVWPKPGGGRP